MSERDPIVIAPPPVALMFDGPAQDYSSNGLEYLELYKKYGGITPRTNILDIGCGIGRKTIPLVNFLTPDTLYLGIDCKREGIDWCEQNITKVAPNFVFLFENIHAPGYNPHGRILPEHYKFPIDTQWDFICANSVFTHMRYHGIRQYLREMKRCAAPGARIFTTWFVLDPLSQNVVHDTFQRVLEQLPYKTEHGRIQNEGLYEQMVAYDWHFIKELHASAGLEILDFVPGYWTKGSPIAQLPYQDIIVSAPR